jgi:hypothetical protein
MWLVRIVPVTAHTHKGTFECPTCEIAQDEIVARPEVKAPKVGRNSEVSGPPT